MKVRRLLRADSRTSAALARARRRMAYRRRIEAPPIVADVTDDVTASPTITLTEVLADLLPRPVLILAAWAIVVTVVAVAGSILQDSLGALSMVVIPVALALILAALLTPVCHLLCRIGLHRAIAALLAVVVPTTTGIMGIVVASSEIASGASQLASKAQDGVDSALLWLRTGPLQITDRQLTDYLDQAAAVFRADTSMWSSGALNAGVAVLDIIAGIIICLITAFFFLLDGRNIWLFCVRFVPRGVRSRVHEAGRRGWVSLGAYSRAQILVASADAIGIALGAWALGLPLVLPIFVLVLACSFVPIIGMVVAGLVPTLIAFVAKGPLTALAMLGIVLVVQQLEAHLLQPFLMGRAVDLHPLAVILAVSCATYLYGIPGALFAIPVLAFVNSSVRYLTGHDPFPELGRQPLPRR